MNLAIEEAILRCRLEGKSPDTLRFWRNPPSVIIGCFQIPWKEVNPAICKELGISVFRRASGGGAVYHDYGNLNYSLIIHKSSLEANLDDVEKSYDIFCSGVIEGLRMLGVNAYNRGNSIMIGERKISGSAQHRLYDVILHHGTLMVNVDLHALEHALNLSNVERQLVNLKTALSENVSLSKIKKAIVKGFEKTLNVKFKKGSLSPEEWQAAKMLRSIKYGTSKYIFNRVVETKPRAVDY
ncbi:MAG: lipoate--protein ligase family protein [Candidatus Bathyarchaeia archaeon]